MLQFVVFFDCHGVEYINQLKQCKDFNDQYICSYIPIQKYIDHDFGGYVAKKISSADVILLQHIKNDRPYIHHERIQKMLKSTCKFIMLPHYVFSGYWIDYDIPDDYVESKTDDELINILENINIEHEKIISNYEKSLDEFNNVDSHSTISMYDYVCNNAKNIRLFNSRSYPTIEFCFEVSKRICKFLQINCDFDICHSDFASNVRYPILNIVTKILNLQFNEQYIETMNYKILNIHYILLCKQLNLKYLILSANKFDLKLLENLINTRSKLK